MNYRLSGVTRVKHTGPRDAAELYATIDPTDGGFALEEDFPVGTFIVHEAVNREEGHAIQVKLGPRDAEHFDELGRGGFDLQDEVVDDTGMLVHGGIQRQIRTLAVWLAKHLPGFPVEPGGAGG